MQDEIDRTDPEPSALPVPSLELTIPSRDDAHGPAGLTTAPFGGPDDGPPVRIGRFTVVRQLGRGAMGEVYAAYDAELDRRVAIKLLRRRQNVTTERFERALRREAQAIAKLSHPNVVPVFEVGSEAGRLFLVMELVEGTTLRKWSTEPGRTRDEILDMFEQVGLGLAAAHAAGIVHRDLKPDNVLVGEDGRARLVDFGLARPEADPSTETEPSEGASSELPDQTRASAAAGTPRYMSAEQFRGGRVDHRADEFAFCVSLYQALLGVPPFTGDTVAAIAAKVMMGQIDPPPPDRRVSRPMMALLRRGLALDPDARFGDMRDLLAELRRVRRLPRRRAAYAGVGLVLVAVAGAGAWRDRQRRACARQAQVATDAWNEARDDIAAAIRGTGAPYADHAIAQIGPIAESYATAWGAARTASCLADEGDADVRRDDCLADRLASFEASLDVLATADVQVASRAVLGLSGLPPIGACTDPAQLAAVPVPTQAQRASVRALRPELARVDALVLAGLDGEAHAEAGALTARVEATEHPPTIVSWLRTLAHIDDSLGDYELAEARLREAYFLAGRHALDLHMAHAATSLVAVLGTHVHDFAEADRWLPHAQMLAARIDDPELQLALLHAEGGLAVERGDHATALDLLPTALARSEALHGAGHPDIGIDLIALGTARSSANQLEAAQADLERARTLLTEALGASHPLVADAIHNLANLHLRAGHPEPAIALHREALAIRRAALPDDHIALAWSHAGLGAAFGTAGDTDRARDQFERALAIQQRALGPDHPRLVDTISNIGLTLIDRRPADALAYFERACKLLEGTQSNADQAGCHHHMGEAMLALDRPDEAVEEFRSALDLRRETIGEAHPSTASTMHWLGRALAADGRTDEGLDWLVRGEAGLTAALGPDHPLTREAKAVLARTREGDPAVTTQ